MADLGADIAAVLDLVERTEAPRGCRKTIGIVGAPGSGKSTLAAALVERLNQARHGQAVLVPMDGFHMDNAALDRHGLRALKGAPQTFEVEAFIETLRALRPKGATGAVPLFDRAQDRTLPAARDVGADVDILVVEGNYLLLPTPPWNGVGALLDATVALMPTLPTLERRLMARWLSLGLPPDHAHRKTHENDLKNARLVLEDSAPATLILHQADVASQATRGLEHPQDR